MLVFSVTGFFTFLSTTIFVLGYISNNSLFPEPLSSKEEKEYIDKFESGDKEARDILIERNLRLVAHIAKKYENCNEQFDDLILQGKKDQEETTILPGLENMEDDSFTRNSFGKNEQEAILQMDLIGHDFFVFKNEDEECVSVLYTRKDGSYGILNVK